VTDTAVGDWDAGFELGDDPDVITPAAVTPPVTRRVTWGVTSAVTPPVTPAGDGPVTPGGGDPDGPLGVGEWDEAPDDPGVDRDGGLAAVIARLAALAKGSPLLGGSALAAELADPHPGTLREHWKHVTSHKNRPAGLLAAAGFVAGHLAFTGPLKLTGKAMTVTGNALTWTGKRADRAGDNFTAAVIFIVLVTVITAFLVIAAGEVISFLYLP
jgi:hypothetical protein